MNIALGMAALYGAVLAVREQNLQQPLAVRHRTLCDEVGFLDIADPNKVHVVALSSDDPLRFRWRIYLPANYPITWRMSDWHDRTHSSSDPQEFVARVGFRKNEHGRVMVYSELKTLGNVGALGGHELREFLLDRWDEMEQVQLGADGPVTVEQDEAVTLMQLRMPKAMAEQAEAALPAAWARQFVPVLYEVQFGTKEALEAADQRKDLSGSSNR